MKIGLIDVDGHNFPNLALMKLSAHHKQMGDQVEWWNGLVHYDRVYKAKVFDSNLTEDEGHCIMADEVIAGGTGYDLKNILPNDIEHMRPDYSMYGVKDKAIGFITRGCPRGCPFCIVAEKEGHRSYQVSELGEFWKDEKEIVLLDPNITASKECEKIFDVLIQSKAFVDFNQGLDIRMITEKGASQLNEMRIKTIHFAWDNYEFDTYEKLKKFRPLIKLGIRNTIVYVLTNYNTTHEQDLERIYKLKELGYWPYVMIFDKSNSPKLTRKMARWVNNRFIFGACDRFEDYDTSF